MKLKHLLGYSNHDFQKLHLSVQYGLDLGLNIYAPGNFWPYRQKAGNVEPNKRASRLVAINCKSCSVLLSTFLSTEGIPCKTENLT